MPTYPRVLQQARTIDGTGTYVRPNVVIAGPGIDPTGNADSTTAIQALLDSAAALFASCLVWWPEGTYRVRQLTPHSGQTWDGPGMYAVTIQHQQANINPYNFSMLVPAGDLSNVEIRNLGFRGTRAAGQTMTGTPGLHGMWWFSTGNLTNINVHHCYVRDFGDAEDGSSAIGGGFVATHATGKRSKNVNVTECHFENNGRVPGVYIFSGDADSYDINVTSNRFDVTFTGSVMQQNVVFVLGWSTGGRVHQVDVSSNTIIINAGFIDDPIEVDYAEDFTISGNRILLLAGTQLNCGILVRGNCDSGAITGNTIKSKSTAATVDSGIATLQFNAGEMQENITISGNIIGDIKSKGVWIAPGSKNVTATGNVVRGRNNRTADAFYVTDANDVIVTGNVIEHAGHALRYEGTAIDGLHFTDNIIRDCGINNIYEYLLQSYGSPAMTGVLIAGNTVTAPVAGTGGFASTPFGSATGNRMFGNATAGLTLLNASYATNIAVGAAGI